MRGLDLRKAEMEFYMSRFSMTAGLSSIMTCLSYVGIIKIKIPVGSAAKAPIHVALICLLAFSARRKI